MRKRTRKRRNSRTRLSPLLAALALAALATLPGCYYGHLLAGQTRLWWASQPLDDVLEDVATPYAIRSKLLLVRAATHYARALGLEVDDQYTTYLPWPGDRVITTVVATRPAEVEAAGFSFPILGTLPYKGFFEPERAQREADGLRQQGLDVCVSGVPAYSTLGWLDDPVTEPMLQTSEGRLVETIVHELVHATVFVKGEPEFNESIATFIGQEAAIAYFADKRKVAAERARVREARLLARTLGEFRREVASLYASELSSDEMSRQRIAMEVRMRERLPEILVDTADPEALEALAQNLRLNDACLALRGTYSDDLERHGKVFATLDGDLIAIVARLRAAAETDDPRADFFQNDAS